jgi:uncharacterized protein
MSRICSHLDACQIKDRPAPRTLGGICSMIVCAFVLVAATSHSATADSLRQGVSAFARHDYVRASSAFIPLAEWGDSVAQAYLGFMFETGHGVPQNYSEAAMWYRRAAEQGNGAAQYSLGLLYDKGFGVPRDNLEAHKWLILATSVAAPRDREARARIRDAVATKLSREEIALSRMRALQWVPSREHR